MKKIILVSIFFILAFSFKNTEAYLDFPCNTSVDTRNQSVEITVGATTPEMKYEPSLLTIGILDSTIETYAGYADFKNALDVYSDKVTATYFFNGLKEGTTYRTLIFNKDANDTSPFIKDLSNCKFTVPIHVDGVCGSSVGKTFLSEPTEGLCDSGEFRKVNKNYQEWRWMCYGQNGGNDSPVCIAKVGSSANGGGEPDPVVNASSTGGLLVPDCPADGCGFPEFMQMVRKIINFLLFVIATPLAALVFVYAGIMLLTSGGDPGKLTSAKKMLGNLLIGYVIALAAWLIINTILTSLGYDGTWFLTRY